MPERVFSLVHLLIMLFLILIVFGILLLLVLRLATWLIRKFPHRPGQRVSVVGVAIGGITDVFASSVLIIPLFIYIQIAPKGSAGFASSIHSSGWLYWVQLATGLGGIRGCLDRQTGRTAERATLVISVHRHRALFHLARQRLAIIVRPNTALGSGSYFCFTRRLFEADTKTHQSYTEHGRSLRMRSIVVNQATTLVARTPRAACL
jgi:hypothetical protein